ncbi:hypothetical protein RB12206 [Rhodopirellula baltica SH 1]|uniref:Uncharacterized protein n=1 Tax=Rhodopirellula baltica (strain DSM 10527 / NCIMB 13988 / SH1) TaxID=243090 RepID=Q7UJ10_RHOBA|nr:hypothetical protein RB12206 [Rhodopirellula baltica SH 1]
MIRRTVRGTGGSGRRVRDAAGLSAIDERHKKAYSKTDCFSLDAYLYRCNVD